MVFVQIDKQTLILKMIEKKVFFMKPKHQYLSQWRDCIYDAQSWEERRLLHEFIFILIDRWTLIPKNGGK